MNEHSVQTFLVKAIESNDCTSLETFLKNGERFENINAIPLKDSRQAPLLVAARMGCVRCVAALFESGADLNFRDGPDGRNALIHALIYDQLEVFEQLLSIGADPTLKSYDDGAHDAIGYSVHDRDRFEILKKFTSLETLKAWAEQNIGHMAGLDDEMFKYFVSMGIDLNSGNGYGGESLLHQSVTQPYRVSFLINNGADVNIANNIGETPLHYACKSKGYHAEFAALIGGQESSLKSEEQALRREVVKLLLENGADISAQSFSEHSDSIFPIENAESSGMKEIVHLLRRKFDSLRVDQLDPFLATSMGDIEAIDRIFEVHGHMNFQCNGGLTPLHFAAMKANLKMAIELIKLGANVNAVDDNVWTPLHFARSSAIVRLLLEAGADVNSKDSSGWTRLHLSSQWGESEVIKELLKFEPDLAIENKYGATALGVAVQSGRTEIVDMLFDTYKSLPNEGSLLKFAISNQDLNMLELMLEKGINFQDANLDSAFLHLASHVFPIRNREIVEALVLVLERENFDINILDEKGHTPLYNAVFEAENFSTALVLMQHGGKYSGLSLDQITWLQKKDLDPATAIYLADTYERPDGN